MDDWAMATERHSSSEKHLKVFLLKVEATNSESPPAGDNSGADTDKRKINLDDGPAVQGNPGITKPSNRKTLARNMSALMKKA